MTFSATGGKPRPLPGVPVSASQEEGEAMKGQMTLPGVRLVDSAAERKEVIHERLVGFELRQAARAERRRRARFRKALRLRRKGEGSGGGVEGTARSPWLVTALCG